MSTSDPAAQSAAETPIADLPTGDPVRDVEAASEPTPEAVHEPVIVAREQEVTLQRSVRYGRVLIGGAVIGALILSFASLLFPISEGATYSMGQAVGFMALIGAALGLGLSGLLALALGRAAKRRQGTGVAIQTDVR